MVLNPVGKSDVCILHEYVQHALRLQPKFEFAEMRKLMQKLVLDKVIIEMSVNYCIY